MRHVRKSCERSGEKCIFNQESSSHGKKQTEIISEESLDHEKLKAAIEKTGYQVTSVTEEPYKKKGFSLFGR